MPALSAADLVLPGPRESSAAIAKRVMAARETQRQRYSSLGHNHIKTNSRADGELLEKVASPDAGGQQLLRQASDVMRLSARGYHRILRVARTLADLDGVEVTSRVHIAEALSYRSQGLNLSNAA